MGAQETRGLAVSRESQKSEGGLWIFYRLWNSRGEKLQVSLDFYKLKEAGFYMSFATMARQ